MAVINPTIINESAVNPGSVAAVQGAFIAASSAAGVGGADVNVEEAARLAGEERERQEIARLRSKHTDYTARYQHWMFMLRTYEGGPAYVDETTLHKHQRENRQDFDDRLKRAYFLNYSQPLVDFVPEFIFSQGVERKADPSLSAEFDVFRFNCDRAGTTLDVFMQGVAEDARIFGMCFVQVDKLPAPADQDPESLSVQRASELGIDAPYLVNIKPTEVFDWRVDQTSNYIFLKRVEYLSYLDGDNYVDAERYSEWWPTKKRISTIDVTDQSKPRILSQIETPNVWSEIPFIPVFFKRSKVNRDLGSSFLEDIAKANQQVFNITSLLDEFLARQCFNVLTMEMNTQVPRSEQVDGDMGSSNILEIPKDATHKPEYLSPPVDPAEFLQGERQRCIQEMYRIAAQDLMSEIYASGTKSGDQTKQAFGRTIPVIAKTADMLQVAEHRIFKLWAKLMGKDWKGGKISYRDDYSVTNLQDLILQLSSIFSSVHVMSPTFVREEWKRIVQEFDGKIDADTMSKILKEIDAVSDKTINDLVNPPIPQDTKAAFGLPSAANLKQGRAQQGKSDRQISLATGNNASTKEAVPDANKRAKRGTSQK